MQSNTSRATEPVDFDPYQSELAKNPYPMYQRMRV